MNAVNYKIRGFSTLLPIVEDEQDMVRIIAIVRDELGLDFQLREDLMSADFPSIWVEVTDIQKSKIILGGFYRQWSNKGVRSTTIQVEEMAEFCNQINKTNSSNSKVIIMGDANLCSNKWLNDDYDRKNIANPLLQCLDRNGLEVQNVGVTYQADHVSTDGSLPQSAIDHVYSSVSIREAVKVEKILNSSTDHLPVVTSFILDRRKIKYKHSVTKRSFKNFTQEGWRSCLASQDWSAVENSDEVDSMVSEFQEAVNLALDQIAPIKTFTVRSNHRFGLSEDTKELMRKRDSTRNAIKSADGGEKVVLLQKYRTLRNKVTAQIRRENIDFNNNRIEATDNEGELWKVTNEVLNPRKENDWKIEKEDGDIVTDEKGVADAFNRYFVDKIEKLKGNIDQSMVEDPLVRLKEKMKNNKHKLEFKAITQKQLKNHFKKLKKKKSSGLDGLSQEHLVMGASVLIAPLATIINKSIMSGVFPQQWKIAAVSPVLKKGSAQLLSNYRPISCLPAASKLLEIVVCSQLSDYLEANNLLPKNQHGFRPRRSTMSAWNEIQLDWAEKTEKNLITGVLLWDLSAAFDTLDCQSLCLKLELFGVQPRSVAWVSSFLTGRSQMVRIGGILSSAVHVPTGVPQGGVLSPLIFVLFVSDLQDWLL